MNRFQSAEYERCRNGCGCQNDIAVAGDTCSQCDTCAEAAANNAAAANVANGCGCGCTTAQTTAATNSNGNGNGCHRCRTADAVRDLGENACVCAVIAKINELLAVLRDAGVIDDCD